MPLPRLSVPSGVDPATGTAWLGPRLTSWTGTWSWTVDVPATTMISADIDYPGPFDVLGQRFGAWGISTAGTTGFASSPSTPTPGGAITDGQTISATVTWTPSGASNNATLLIEPYIELMIDRGDGAGTIWVAEAPTTTSIQASPGYVGVWGWDIASYDSAHGLENPAGSVTGTDTVSIVWDGTFVGSTPFPPVPYIGADIATDLAAVVVESNTATGGIWGYSGPAVGSDGNTFEWFVDTSGDYLTTYTGRLIVGWTDGSGDADAYPLSYPTGRWVLNLRVNYVAPTGGGLVHGHPIGAGYSGLVVAR